jgi:hypothetical protein
MASGINGTMRQVGVALGFAGLGAILAHRTAHAFAQTVGTLGLTTDQVGPLTARVIKGDIASAMATLPAPLQHGFRFAAGASMFEGVRMIALVAGIVGLVGAVLTYLLMRPLVVSHIEPEEIVIPAHGHH